MIKIHRRLLLLATTALLPLGPAFAQNLPTGGQFVGGTSGAISSSGNTMTVQTNSNRSITNWTTFNIGSGYQVNINQPNSGSVALERVTGGLGPSSIFGTLTSNGIVFLLNPNGILFGRGAVVNVGGFLASTNRISNSDFLAGHYRFHGGNPSVSIVNYGSITAATGGFAALVAPGVRNSGTITATLGTVGLAAGRGFSLDLYGDNLINLAVNDKLAKQVIDVATGQPLSSLITNTGKISANGGRVEITAAAARNIVSSVINTTGVIEANSIGRHDGMIVLNGGSGNVQVAGTLSASGKRKGTKGGTIEIAGENISVTGAKINASGKDGGGTVLIGGGSSGRNYGGGGFSDNAVRGNDWSGSQNAQNVTINSRSLINVSAYERGSGGTVSIESNQLTTFAGLIEATGGRFDGRGGNVVTQGGAIDIAGARVNTGAPNGRDGSWLIEAMTLNIDPGAAAAIQASLATTNVTLQTNARYSGFEQNVANGTGDITINAPITWSTRNALTLDATNAVTVNATIDVAGPGKVNIRAATDPNYGIAQLAFGSGGSVQFTGTPDSGQALSINGQSYTLLYSMSGLQSIIDGNLSGNYALAKPLDATSVASWVPIGTNESGSMNGNGFTGIFQGLGNTISNLTIAPTAQNLDSIGFFGSIGVGGVVENLKLTNATVTANQFLSDSIPGQFVGVLAGENAGLIENVSVSGTVNGGTATGVNAGGLVGQNGVFGPGDFQAAGTVRNARADVNVILGSGCSGDCNGGYNSAGGLVGFNPGVIAHSEARGAIVVGSNAAAGGLVGTNGNYQQTEDGGSGGPIAGAKIYDSRASGTVSSAGVNVSLGGLVGQNNALSFIGRSRASGAVTSIAVIDPNQNCNDGGNCQTVSAGGLVGQNAGIIIRSAAHGDVSVENFAQAGGLVGINQGYRGEEGWYATAKIIDSFASGAVTSSGVNITIGGLVGLNGPGATITRSKAFGDVTSTANISAETNQNCDSGNCQYVNAGGLAGQNAGVIVRSSAHGDVTVGSFAQAGGLVGLNGGVFGDSPIRGAAIFDSSASGAVSSSGVSVTLGGLVGENQAGSLIKNSRATSDVTSTASSQGDCANNANCLNSVVGGLVGQNSGVIAGRWFDGTPTKCRSGDTCASGTVSVGSEGIAGGLVGDNTGIIKNAFAIANVIGAAGSPGASQHEFNNQTTLGGFAGVNSGLIKNSFAVGTVGSSGVNWLQAGGFVGDNSGVISRSFANVAVSAGDNSVAGGFAGSNAQNVDSSCCGGGNYNNKALITRSAAIGDVSVGASSIAGGFAAYGDGSFYRVSGSGAVSALGNSTVGGLVGALDVGGTISRSKADNTLVSSTGPNSTVGGLVGANGGTVSNSISTSPVTGGADSFIGGLAGANFGSITNSKVDPVITGNGPNDVLGGIVGLNIGQLSGNTANVMLVSNGSGNQVGSVAGVNGTYNFTGANPFTPGASTQTGDIGNSTSTGSSFSSIGSTVPPSAPAFPNWVPNCSATLCDGINNGFLQTAGGNQSNTGDTGNSNSGVNGNYGSQQTASFTVPPIPNNNTSLNLNAPNFNQQSGGAGGIGGNSANGGTNGGGSNNGATGSLGSGTHGGNGAPPGTRLIDMPVIPLPPESGMPPPGETHFVSNEVSLHVGNGMSLQQIEQIAQQFGLTIVATNSIGMLGRTIYTLQISDGRTVQEVITAFQSANLPVWVGYVPKYGFAQEPAGRSADIDPAGDPAQYVIDKFHLPEIHRLARGDNVTIAVIDSEIDVRHPDLAGVVTDRYDAGCGATMPDAHGTGMTGAIASRRNLLGVAPKVKVIAICAFGGEATAESTSLKIIKGIDYAVSQGAKIINMSFAGPRDPALSQALQIAREKGVLLVAAAGNAGPKSPPLYPGADANVMAVTATDDHDRLFNRANQGKYISVAAPGVDILVPAPGGGVALTTGTSVATAHVTGVAALLLAQKSTRTPEELRAILVTTAKDLGPKGFDTQFGAGLVDPLRALQYGSAKSAAIRLPALGR